MYTVKQLADLAGITVRTVHHYDEIGLLKPSSVGANGYRYYTEEAILRMQQILFYRELDFDLLQIKKILADPHFDLLTALQAHRLSLQERMDRIQTLIHTVDTTIMHIVGEINMEKKNLFAGFNPVKEKLYEEEATRLWGENVTQSARQWKSYDERKKAQIMEEGNAIYAEILANMERGPQSPQIQAILGRWHQHLRYFYEPSLEVLRGLGDLYNDHPDFNANFTALHPDLPAFIQKAIACYVDDLETRGLEDEPGHSAA